MTENGVFPLVGLGFGTALGFAGAFGGFGAFVFVLLLGTVGFLTGRALAGELDLGEVFGTAGSRRRPS